MKLHQFRLDLLTHQSTETFEGSRNADMWVYLDKNTACRVNIHLQQTGFVQWRIQKSQ